MDLWLDDRMVVVTGAASGIGRACAEALLAENAIVTAVDRDQDGLARLTSSAGKPERLIPVVADVGDPGAVDRLFAEIEAVGPVHGLVTAAGVFHMAPLADLASADWDRVMATNLRGTFLCARACIRAMGDVGGSVVCVGSLAGQAGGLYAGADYAASKGGVIALTKALARQAAPSVRVNCVNPGVIDTPMTATFPADLRAGIAAGHPLRRWGTVEEVAPVILLLLSARASFVTGTHFDVNGGAYV